MKQSSGIIQENTCVLPDRAFQVMGFQADVDQNTAPQHQSQGDQEENQIRPGGCLLLRSFAATALAFPLPRLWRIPMSPVQRPAPGTTADTKAAAILAAPGADSGARSDQLRHAGASTVCPGTLYFEGKSLSKALCAGGNSLYTYANWYPLGLEVK